MSQKDDSEKDIWEYKPLKKKKKRSESLSATANVSKRCIARKTSRRGVSSSVKSPDTDVKTAEDGVCCSVTVAEIPVDGHNRTEAHIEPSKSSPTNDTGQIDNGAEGPFSEDYCPMCQMPFSVLVVQTHRWHVAECLDTPRDTCKGKGMHVSSKNEFYTRYQINEGFCSSDYLYVGKRMYLLTYGLSQTGYPACKVHVCTSTVYIILYRYHLHNNSIIHKA